MGDTVKLMILISMAQSAQKQAPDDLQEMLDNMDEFRLFHGKGGRILLPLPDVGGLNTLVLSKPKDGGNYFECRDFIGPYEMFSAPTVNYKEVSSAGMEVRIADNPNSIGYKDRLCDHGGIRGEVINKPVFDPGAGEANELKKWNGYLRLYERVIKEQKSEFILTKIRTSGGESTGHVDGDDDLLDRIDSARGESVLCSVVPRPTKRKRREDHGLDMGEVKSVRGHGNVTIKLHKDFLKGFRKLLKNDSRPCRKFCSGELSGIGGEICFDQLPRDADVEHIVFCDAEGEIIAAGSAVVEESQIRVDSASVKPHRLHCYVDYAGDAHQVRTMKLALGKIQKMPIWQVLTRERTANLPDDEQRQSIKFYNKNLNDEQKEAVQGALTAPELFLIWGPPGTGKTEVIAEIAAQEAARGYKTLICSQMNLAVDNALARLYNVADCFAMRLSKKSHDPMGEDSKKIAFHKRGEKSSLNSPFLFLDYFARDYGLSTNKRRQTQKALNVVSKDVDNASDMQIRQFRQMAELYKRHINIVGCTLMGVGLRKFGKPPTETSHVKENIGIDAFDTVIVDEVSKATHPELFIPVSLGKRLILVGDYKQLPPMFKFNNSKDEKGLDELAKEAGMTKDDLDLDSTLFKRLWEKHDGAEGARLMLRKQYRMLPEIQKIIEPFYQDKGRTLQLGLSDQQVSELRIQNIPILARKERAAIWIGTKEASYEQAHGTSFINEDEVKKVGQLLQKFADVHDDKNPMTIGVITFYGAQLRELRREYKEKYVKIFGDKLIWGTVDRFQGRECDIIICSLVRNNREGIIGFAAKPERLTVAFSRARRALIILGSKTVFCFEGKNKPATKQYQKIYDLCARIKPKELGSHD